MPTYEYVCTKCGEGLEAVQSFSDPPLTKCPNCKGTDHSRELVGGYVGLTCNSCGAGYMIDLEDPFPITKLPSRYVPTSSVPSLEGFVAAAIRKLTEKWIR